MTTIDREHLRKLAQDDSGLCTPVLGPDETITLLDMLDAAEARVQRVRDLHHPWGDTLSGTRLCDACDQPWPCATVRALDGDE